MKKIGRLGAALVALAVAGMCAVAPTPAAAAPPEWMHGPMPVTNWLWPGVRAHNPTWVDIVWQTDVPVCDGQVTVKGDAAIDVQYPADGTYTSFYRDSSLRPGQPDFTAIKITAHYRTSRLAFLRATITYNDCGSPARTHRSKSLLALPVYLHHKH